MKNLPIVKVPIYYTLKEMKKLRKSVEKDIRENRPIVIPENIEICSLPIID